MLTLLCELPKTVLSYDVSFVLDQYVEVLCQGTNTFNVEVVLYLLPFLVTVSLPGCDAVLICK